VETAGFGGYSAKQFHMALENAGLKCASSHFFSFGSGDPGPLFEDANTLGVHYTVSSGIGRFTNKPAGTSMTADDYKGMAEYCNQLGQKANRPDCSSPTITTISNFRISVAARWDMTYSSRIQIPIL
jgi:hypothetical protein